MRCHILVKIHDGITQIIGDLQEVVVLQALVAVQTLIPKSLDFLLSAKCTSLQVKCQFLLLTLMRGVLHKQDVHVAEDLALEGENAVDSGDERLIAALLNVLDQVVKH